MCCELADRENHLCPKDLIQARLSQIGEEIAFLTEALLAIDEKGSRKVVVTRGSSTARSAAIPHHSEIHRATRRAPWLVEIYEKKPTHELHGLRIPLGGDSEIAVSIVSYDETSRPHLRLLHSS